MYSKGIYPVIYNRTDKFPDGESVNDLAARAGRAVEECVMKHVWEALKTGEKQHMALVSHGVCISEMITALWRKDQDVQTGSRG